MKYMIKTFKEKDEEKGEEFDHVHYENIMHFISRKDNLLAQ